MGLQWKRDEQGVYRASNGAADFEIEKVENVWFVECNRKDGGTVFARYYRFKDAKAKAESVGCRAGWHKV